MATILKGAAVAQAISERTARTVAALKAQGVTPTLAIVRAGERPDEIAYERGATKRALGAGVAVRNVLLPEAVPEPELIAALEALNADAAVHGVLLLRPLPPQVNDEAARGALAPSKDIDGITDTSLTGVFTNERHGFAPCTPQACLEILDHYGYELEGRRVVVVGRSLVVGRPLALMLLERNATVTIAHSRTHELASLTREADIVIACVGCARLLGAQHVARGQVIIDVGINVAASGALVGDVDFEQVEPLVEAITPVPGGVGTVTSSVLIKHVVEAATP